MIEHKKQKHRLTTWRLQESDNKTFDTEYDFHVCANCL